MIRNRLRLSQITSIIALSLATTAISGLSGCKQGSNQSAKNGELAQLGTTTEKYRLISIDNHIVPPRSGVDRICDRIAKCTVRRSGSNVYVSYDGKPGETWVFLPLSHTVNFDNAQQAAAQTGPLSAASTEANLTFDGPVDAIRIDLYEGSVAQHVPTGNVRFDFPIKQ